jgi:hypothetical protein
MKNDLKKLNAPALVEGLILRVRTERKLTSEIIEFIQEIDCRKTYLEYGVTSLFAFLTEIVGYSRSAAQRRIEAARLSNDIPEIHDSLKSGEINLSHISLLAQGIKQKEKESQEKLKKSEKKDLVDKFKSKPLEKCEVILAQTLDLQLKSNDVCRRQKDESVRAEMTFTKEELEEIERAKSILSHQLLNPKPSELFMFLVRDLLKRKDPLKKHIASDSSAHRIAATQENEITPVSGQMSSNKSSFEQVASSVIANQTRKDGGLKNNRRYIKIATDSAIHSRDRSCRWRDPITGKTCGSTFQLQRDHIVSVWAGGTNDIGNLQLLCGVHNRMKYRLEAVRNAKCL